MLSWISIAAPLLFVFDGVVSLGIAAEIVVENVKPSESKATVTRYGLTREDFRRISSALPGVQQIVPVRTMPIRAVQGERELSLQLIGTVAGYEHRDKLTLKQGRFLMAKDVDNRNNIAVVDALTAQRLFPDGRAIGKNIRISNHYFLIVGLLTPEPETSRKSREVSGQGRVFIPLTTMRSRYGDMVLQSRTGSMQVEHYELSRIHVVVATATNVNQAVLVIQSLMNKYHEKQDYSVRTVGTSARM